MLLHKIEEVVMSLHQRKIKLPKASFFSVFGADRLSMSGADVVIRIATSFVEEVLRVSIMWTKDKK